MRLACAAVLGAVMMLCTGCASFVTGGGPDQKIRVVSTPPGADVYIDGVHKGVTPTSITITRVDEHLLRVVLAGYEPFEKTITPGFNPWVLGNAVLALAFIVPGVVGVVIDSLSGAWIWVGGDVHATLKPISPGSAYSGTAGTPGARPSSNIQTTAPPRAGPGAGSGSGSYLPPRRAPGQ